MRRPFTFVSSCPPHASATSSSALFHGAIRPGACPWRPTSSSVGTCGGSSSSHVGGRRDPSQPRWTSSSVPVRLSSLAMERTTTNPSDFDRISTRTILRGHALSPLVQWDGFCPSKGGISHVSQRTFLGSTLSPPPLGFPFPRSKGDVFPFPSGLSFDPRRGRTGPLRPTSGKRIDHEIDPTPTFTPTTVVVVVVVGWTSG